jgi:hypothetical protein
MASLAQLKHCIDIRDETDSVTSEDLTVRPRLHGSPHQGSRNSSRDHARKPRWSLARKRAQVTSRHSTGHWRSQDSAVATAMDPSQLFDLALQDPQPDHLAEKLLQFEQIKADPLHECLSAKPVECTGYSRPPVIEQTVGNPETRREQEHTPPSIRTDDRVRRVRGPGSDFVSNVDSSITRNARTCTQVVLFDQSPGLGVEYIIKRRALRDIRRDYSAESGEIGETGLIWISKTALLRYQQKSYQSRLVRRMSKLDLK